MGSAIFRAVLYRRLQRDCSALDQNSGAVACWEHRYRVVGITIVPEPGFYVERFKLPYKRSEDPKCMAVGRVSQIRRNVLIPAFATFGGRLDLLAPQLVAKDIFWV